MRLGGRRPALLGAMAVGGALLAAMAVTFVSAPQETWRTDPSLQQVRCPIHWARAGATCWAPRR